jgi:hypothetical protein
LRQYGRTATEARVRSPSEESAFKAEPERWSRIRTRDPMSDCHLLYQTELSFVAQETGIEPTPSGYNPTLSMSYILLPRTAEHETGDRPAPVGITTSPNPWPKRRSGSINETSLSCKCVFKNSARVVTSPSQCGRCCSDSKLSPREDHNQCTSMPIRSDRTIEGFPSARGVREK